MPKKQLCESLRQTCKREKKWLLLHTDKISLGRKPATGEKKKKYCHHLRYLNTALDSISEN